MAFSSKFLDVKEKKNQFGTFSNSPPQRKILDNFLAHKQKSKLKIFKQFQKWPSLPQKNGALDPPWLAGCFIPPPLFYFTNKIQLVLPSLNFIINPQYLIFLSYQIKSHHQSSGFHPVLQPLCTSIHNLHVKYKINNFWNANLAKYSNP